MLNKCLAFTNKLVILIESLRELISTFHSVLAEELHDHQTNMQASLNLLSVSIFKHLCNMCNFVCVNHYSGLVYSSFLSGSFIERSFSVQIDINIRSFYWTYVWRVTLQHDVCIEIHSESTP